MGKAWMPRVAGILDIVAGALSLFLITVAAGFVIAITVSQGAGPVKNVPDFTTYVAIASPFLCLSILAIVGGIYALRGKKWGLALAGSIAAIFEPWLWFLGIAATVFIALSKSEFE
jgi:hypothetical protein